MKILVVFTGGTIGCVFSDKSKTLDVLKNRTANTKWNEYYLLNEYNKRTPDKKQTVFFETIEPIQTLSENMTIREWNILINTFKTIEFAEYDGIIITHGTDTMAYTASLFGMLLAGISVPVVFVGSNYELTDPRADGHANFSDAVDFIRRSRLTGVYVIFKSKVFLSTRIKQSKHYTDEYVSENGIDLGYMKDGEFVFNNVDGNPRIHSIDHSSAPLLYKAEELKSCVGIISPYIGLDYSFFNLNSGIKAILHGTYHSFTACIDDRKSNYSILTFQKACEKNNITLYLAPFTRKLTEESADRKYVSIKEILENNVYYMSNMSLESAYAKLLIGYNLYHSKEEIKQFLSGQLFFEWI